MAPHRLQRFGARPVFALIKTGRDVYPEAYG
jgi:hypothetical protein